MRDMPPRLRGSASSLSGTVEAYARHVMRTWSLERTVMVLACTPLLLGPPLLALCLIGREATRNLRPFRIGDWSTPALVAILNLILSVIALQQIGGELLVLVKHIGFWFQEVHPSLTPVSPLVNV